jgi:hypothetical protein
LLLELREEYDRKLTDCRIDNDIAKSAGRIELIRAAFREALTTLSDLPFDTLSPGNNLGAILGITSTVS